MNQLFIFSNLMPAQIKLSLDVKTSEMNVDESILVSQTTGALILTDPNIRVTTLAFES